MDIPLEFRRWFIDFLIEHLRSLEQDELEAQESPNSYPRIHGQISSDGTFTGRQSTFNPRPRMPHTSVMIGGRRVALGDSKKQYTRPLPPLRNSPVVVLSALPYQPIASPAAAEQPLSHSVKGQLEALPGFVAAPRKDDGILPLEGPEAKYPFTDEVAKVLGSAPVNPGGPLLDFNTDLDLLYQLYPLPRPYHTLQREVGSVTSPKTEQSFVGWADSIFHSGSKVRDLPPANIAASVTIPPVYYLAGGSSCAELAPSLTIGVSIGIVPQTFSDRLTAQRWTQDGNDTFFNAAGEAIEIPYNATYYRFEFEKRFTETFTYSYQHSTTATYPGKLPKGNAKTYDSQGFCEEPVATVFVTETVTVRVNGVWFASEHDVGGFYEKRYTPGIQANVSRGASYETERRTELTYDGATDTYSCKDIGPYRVGPGDGYGIGSTGSGVGEVFTDARTFLIADAIKNCYPPVTNTPPLGALLIDRVEMANVPALGVSGSGLEGSITKKLSRTEIEAIVSDYFGLPENLTGTEARVEQFVPYIYDMPLDAGRLRNPLAGPGPSSFYGLSWSSPFYVCDAFYALDLEAVEHLYAVAIIEQGSAYDVLVSVDRVQVGSWSLLDFFPGNDGTLNFLSGETWPPSGKLSVKQNYDFAHAEWPFRDVARLSPFTARLRGKQDKSGQQFTAAAADAPITLFLESYPDNV